jgi:SPP1 gp7 family putative phage head morphogenesis protein
VRQIGVELAFDLENPKVQETLHLLALEVRGISDTTREEIRGIVGRMASEGISYEAAALEIVQLAGIHSEARARTIAVTESARAWTQGSILAWQESGEVDRMEWSAEPDCCPICRTVQGTVVPLGTPFQGLMPPAHPNCRCALLPVLTDA